MKNTAEYNWGWTFSGLPVVRNTYVDYMIQDNIKFIPPVAYTSYLARGYYFVVGYLWFCLWSPYRITAIWILGMMSISGKGLNVTTYMCQPYFHYGGDSIHFLSGLNIYLDKDIDIKEALAFNERHGDSIIFN